MGIRLVIVEDQRLIADAIAATIREHIPDAEVTILGSLEAAFGNLTAFGRADCALIDYRMHSDDSVGLVHALWQNYPGVKLCWVTSICEDYLLHQAIASNLPGFVHKDDEAEILITAIRRLLAGHTFVSPRIVSLKAALTAKKNNFAKILSLREQEILGLLGRGLSNEEAGALLGLSAGTLQAHRRNLLLKLDIHSTSELITYAVAHGFTRVESLSTRRRSPSPVSQVRATRG